MAAEWNEEGRGEGRGTGGGEGGRGAAGTLFLEQTVAYILVDEQSMSQLAHVA